MRRYVLVSGLFLGLLAVVQVVRLVLGWSVTVDGTSIPLWASGIAAIIAGGLAIWAFQVNARTASTTAV